MHLSRLPMGTKGIILSPFPLITLSQLLKQMHLNLVKCSAFQSKKKTNTLFVGSTSLCILHGHNLKVSLSEAVQTSWTEQEWDQVAKHCCATQAHCLQSSIILHPWKDKSQLVPEKTIWKSSVSLSFLLNLNAFTCCCTISRQTWMPIYP